MTITGLDVSAVSARSPTIASSVDDPST